MVLGVDPGLAPGGVARPEERGERRLPEPAVAEPGAADEKTLKLRAGERTVRDPGTRPGGATEVAVQEVATEDPSFEVPGRQVAPHELHLDDAAEQSVEPGQVNALQGEVLEDRVVPGGPDRRDLRVLGPEGVEVSHPALQQGGEHEFGFGAVETGRAETGHGDSPRCIG